MNGKEVLKFAEKNGVEMVDFKFCDFPGTWQHFATPVSELEEEIFEDGLGFDGSSIQGWKWSTLQSWKWILLTPYLQISK